MEQEQYRACVRILHRELAPAFGCTEPIAIAYAAAQARRILGCIPEQITVRCSGNIVKNVKGVVVPATDGLCGIEAAAVTGAVGGEADSGLEVLHAVTNEHRHRIRELLRQNICRVELLDTQEKLHLIVEMSAGGENALAEVRGSHTGIVRMEKNHAVVFSAEQTECGASEEDCGFLSFDTIYEFAQTVCPEDVCAVLDRQIRYNTEIAEYGLAHACGAGIGAMLRSVYGDNVRTMARALPAAGSDARMSGCGLPVVINSGSGNQGMTVSLPVIAYARALGVSREQLYRALCVSNLSAIYQKQQIGRLSAYCGAVSAGAGAGAGIAYLMGGSAKQIAGVVSNTLANVAGIFCDGAKASCAAKIASCVEAAQMAVEQTFRERSFRAGDGIVQNTPDATVETVAMIARDGMRTADELILQAMVGA